MFRDARIDALNERGGGVELQGCFNLEEIVRARISTTHTEQNLLALDCCEPVREFLHSYSDVDGML